MKESVGSTSQKKILTENDLKQIMHPDDKSAIKAINTFPGFKQISEFVLSKGVEKMFYGNSLAKCIKIGPNQLPDIYNLLPPICEKLGMGFVPEFFLETTPTPNAYTTGNDKVIIVVTSGLLSSLTTKELEVVIAHECGHVMFKHCLNMMIAQMLKYGLQTTFARVLTLGGSETLELLFYRWQRMSELSADRIAALYAGNAKETASALIKIGGGIALKDKAINFDEFLKQVKEYENLMKNTKIDSTIQNLMVMRLTHPFSTVRVQNIYKWCDTPLFKRLSKKINTVCCKTCSAPMKEGTNICVNGHFN